MESSVIAVLFLGSSVIKSPKSGLLVWEVTGSIPEYLKFPNDDRFGDKNRGNKKLLNPLP